MNQAHLAALVVACFAVLAGSAAAQQPMPFPGSGDTPPAVPAEVYVSAYLDRMLNVDDRAYTFHAVLWVYLSWRDPRMAPMVLNTTAKLTEPNSTYECTFPCQSNGEPQSGGCCDGVWTPYIAFTNLQALPQDRVVRYGIGADTKSDNVFYWTTIQGIWYTGMNLRAFPFDTQQLLVQLEVPQARTGWAGSIMVLKPSTMGAGLFTEKGAGDQLSGWEVTSIAMQEFKYELCGMPLRYATGPSVPSDPSPLVPDYLEPYIGRFANASGCAEAIARQPEPSSSVYWRAASAANKLIIEDDVVPPGPIAVSGLNIVINVRRYYSPYIMTAIFPIAATTWLAFMVFFLPRQDMEARLGAVTGLFLALAAIQFVVQDSVPASSYVTAMQQLVLTSYVCLILVGLMNLVIWHFTVYHKTREMLRRHHQAQREFEDKLAGVRSAVDAWLHRAHHQASTGSAASEGTRVVPSAMEGAAPPAAASGGSGQQGVAQDASPGAADAPQHGKRGLPDAGGMQIASAALAALQAATAAKAVAGAGPGPAGTSAAALHGGPPPPAPAQRHASDGKLEEGLPSSYSQTSLQSLAQTPRWQFWRRWRLRLRLMQAAIADSPEYADHVAHKFNKWCAISMFVLYNCAIILIFSVNTAVNS